MKNIVSRSFAVLGCAAVVLSGCATGRNSSEAPPFSPPADKALIYVYRPPKILGNALAHRISVNKQYVCDLPNNSYLGYLATPGATTMSAQLILNAGSLNLFTAIHNPDRELLSLNTEAGRTYYVKFRATPEKMTLMDEATGAAEIKGRQLVSPPYWKPVPLPSTSPERK